MSETIDPYNPFTPAAAELADPHYRVEILTAYTTEVAIGIGRLMPQLDPTFSAEPTSRDKLERIISNPERCQIVALSATGEVAAAATMNTLMGAGKEDEGWLEDFIVDENSRGSGLSQLMWNAMGNWCRSRGLKQFSFGTETWRPAAINFYNRMGASTDVEALHLTYRLPEQQA